MAVVNVNVETVAVETIVSMFLQEEEAEEEEIEDVYIPYVAPVAKEWLTYGSEREIEEETIVEHRKKVITVFLIQIV